MSRQYPVNLHMPQGPPNGYSALHQHTFYSNHMMKGYATNKRGPMNTPPFGDMRKIPLSNPLHIADNAWSTDRITLSSEEYLYYVNLFK
ncbi:hypothetical protein PVNG_01614 [Plasmodium vivax North Korean]|uniref:Uncharacterized protein n=1 Tax=Plasmodium vivax North Korean TaxID=1035514 RepID=A0A0J9U0Y6_PLAVI|nr:hypothetical protein PVNG_01614 [Plasmodium vivax North Korean]